MTSIRSLSLTAVACVAAALAASACGSGDSGTTPACVPIESCFTEPDGGNAPVEAAAPGSDAASDGAAAQDALGQDAASTD